MSKLRDNSDVYLVKLAFFPRNARTWCLFFQKNVTVDGQVN